MGRARCTKHPIRGPQDLDTRGKCRECQRAAMRRYQERMREAYRQFKAQR